MSTTCCSRLWSQRSHDLLGLASCAPQRSGRTLNTPSRHIYKRLYRGVPSSGPVTRESLREYPSSESKPSYDAPSIHSRLKPSIIRPILFAIGASSLAYTWAAYETNKDTDARIAALKAKTSSFFSGAPRSVDLAMSRRNQLLENTKATMVRLLGPQPDVRTFTTRIYTLTAEWWINKSEAQRTCLALIGVQGIVFLGWRVRPAFLARTFMHYPLSGRSYTMLTSTFSHSSGMHFLFNSLAFYSFGPGTMAYLWPPSRNGNDNMKESTSRYHFIALFIAAGIFSSLVSHVYTLLYSLPRAMTSVAARSSILPSHGASGSIYAMVVVTACAFPDSQISLIFLPFFPFSIGNGVAGIVMFDVVGLLSSRFRLWIFGRLGIMFDHAGHLGGAACGYLAYRFSGPFFDRLRTLLHGDSTKTSKPKRIM